ncbi:MAG: hypothetical protein Q9190_005536 [Brigantiaea leucoxantha]
MRTSAVKTEASEISEVGRPETFSSLLTNDMVSIIVGPKRKDFHIHRDLLINRSPFFASLLSPASPDTKTSSSSGGPIYLDVDANAFALFIDWLYKDKLSGPTYAPFLPQPPSTSPTIDPEHVFKIHILINLYLMAHQWRFPDLKNQVVDKIRDFNSKSRVVMHVEHVKKIYRGTEKGAMLRVYAVDQLLGRCLGVAKVSDEGKKSGGGGGGVKGGSGGGGGEGSTSAITKEFRQQIFRKRIQEGEAEFLVDVFDRLIEMQIQRGKKGKKAFVDPETKDGCCYHEHKMGEECDNNRK